MISKTYLHEDNMRYEYTMGEIDKYNMVNSEQQQESSSHVEENNLPKLIPSSLKTAYPIFPGSIDIPIRKHSKQMSHPINTGSLKESEIFGNFRKQVNLKHTINGNKNLNIVILERNSSISNRSYNRKRMLGDDEGTTIDNLQKSYTINEEDEFADRVSIGGPSNVKNYYTTNMTRSKSNSMLQTFRYREEIENLAIYSKKNNNVNECDKVNTEILNTSNCLTPKRTGSKSIADKACRKLNDGIVRTFSKNLNEFENNRSKYSSPDIHNLVEVEEPDIVISLESPKNKPKPKLKEQSSTSLDNNYNFTSNQQRRFKRKDISNAKNYFKFRYISEKLIEINNLIGENNQNNFSFANNLKPVNTLTSSKEFSINNYNKDNSPSVVYSADDKNVIKFTCIFLQKMEKSIFLFNMKKYEESYSYLKESNIIKNLEEFAEILLTFPGFDKFIIGEFLSKEKKPNENYEITHTFIKLMDFRGEYFLESFRFLLSRMNLPKDSSLILTILDVFSTVYFQDNSSSNLFQDITSVYLMASTILALNTIFHRDIPNKKLIKKEEFVKMNLNVDKILCEEIYDEVKEKKLDIIYDYNEQIYRKLDINKDDIIMKTFKKESAMLIRNNTSNLGNNNLTNYQNRSDVVAMPNTERTNIINGEELIQMLKQGQKFVKYGRSGHPHDRFVYLSQDENYLNWRPLSCSCFSRERSIKTTSLINIYLGTSNSQIFEKFKIPPEYELNCFSIIFNNRSLDLKHEDQKICAKWYHAIKFLMKRAKSMAEIKKKKLKELTNRKEIISDFWRTEILPNWEKYRKFLLIKGNSNCQNQFFTNYEIYKKRFKNISTEKKTKLIIEEKDKRDVAYLWFLGIPEWLRKKLWSLVIANDINFNENLFNFYLQRNEHIEFHGETVVDRKSMKELTPGGGNEQVVGEFEGIPILEGNKMIEANYHNVENPIVNEIIIDVHKSYRRFEDQIKSENIEEKKFKEELYKILRIFTNYRPDVTYSRPIAYITSVFYLNSEDFYQAFILTTNFIIPSFLTKFLIRDEMFIKTRCEFFENLLGNYMPSVYIHLKNLDISIRLFFYDWIEFLYTKTFKYETIVRIWDCYLAKGEIFLYEVALSIIKLQEKDLVNSTVKGILTSLSYFPDKFTEDDLFEVIEGIDISYEYKLLIEQDELAKEKTHLYSAFLFY